MLRSFALAAMLALTGAMAIAASPASALTGDAFNKCKADSANRFSDYWCEKRY